MTRIYSPRAFAPLIHSHLLNNPRAGLFAPMGFGKTVTVLTALEAADRCGAPAFPVLVLAPRRVCRNIWPKEVGKWAHLSGIRVATALGTADERIAALRQQADVYCINYENVPWLIDLVHEFWPFRTVVADEAIRLKSFRLRQGAKRAQRLSRVAARTSRWINLTGKPSPNGLIDLWGHVWFLDGGERLGRTMDGFKQRWFRKKWNSDYGIEPLPHATDEIAQRLSDICLSLRVEDWFPVDKPQIVDIPVELPKQARKIYRELEKNLYTELLSAPVALFNAASKSIKLLQVANGAAYTDAKESKWDVVHDAKIGALESILAEHAGAPLLVAYHFKPDLAQLRKAFPKAAHIDDKGAIDAWNKGLIPLMFLHPQSAGHGLDLQDGGCSLAFYGNWWNQDNYAQVIERIGPVRQWQSGHPRTVWVYRIFAQDTVDEDVLASVDGKGTAEELFMARLRKWRNENIAT